MDKKIRVLLLSVVVLATVNNEKLIKVSEIEMETVQGWGILTPETIPPSKTQKIILWDENKYSIHCCNKN
ncbi:hypothetical protein [Persephonella sp.]